MPLTDQSPTLTIKDSRPLHCTVLPHTLISLSILPCEYSISTFLEVFQGSFIHITVMIAYFKAVSKFA